MTASPTPDHIPPVCHRCPGAVSPTVSAKRATCDGCAYPWAVAHSVLAGQRGRTPPDDHSVGEGLTVTSVLAPEPRSARPHTRSANAPRRQWAGGWGGLLDRSRQAPRRAGHARLDQTSVSRPSRCRLGRLSRTAAVSDPCFQNQRPIDSDRRLPSTALMTRI